MTRRVLEILVLFLIVFVVSAGAVEAQLIYFTGTQGNQIWVANKDGSGTPAVLFSNAASGSNGPVGIEWLPATGKIYYGGAGHFEVWVANADGSGTPAQLPNTLGPCCDHHDVAVDLAGDRLFFTTRLAIRSGSLDGSGTSTELVNRASIVAVVYDPASDLLYYSNQLHSEIWVANGDGTSPTVLFDGSDGVFDPRDVAIDPANDTIYWTEKAGVIKAGNLDGSGSPVTLFSGLDIPRGLDIDRAAGELYWTEFRQFEPGSDEIVKGNTDGSGTPTVLFSGDFGSVRGISIGLPSPEVPATSARGLILLALVLLLATSVIVIIRFLRVDPAGIGRAG